MDCAFRCTKEPAKEASLHVHLLHDLDFILSAQLTTLPETWSSCRNMSWYSLCKHTHHSIATMYMPLYLEVLLHDPAPEHVCAIWIKHTGGRDLCVSVCLYVSAWVQLCKLAGKLAIQRSCQSACLSSSVSVYPFVSVPVHWSVSVLCVSC